jgi:PKD repeat protein
VRSSALGLAAVLAALALAGCGSDPPEADFTASPAGGEAPLQVTFTDASTNEPAAWRWDFGDGATSTEQSPTHEYQQAGTYTVILTATNDAGSDDVVRRDLITVTPPPNPVCASLQDLKASLAKLTELEPSAGGLEQLQTAAAEIRAEIDELRAAAGEEYGDEVAKVEEAYASVTAAIESLQASPGQAFDELAAAAGDVLAAVAAVESALSKGCG